MTRGTDAMPSIDAAILDSIRLGASRRTDILAALAERGMDCTLPQFYEATRRLMSAGTIARRGERRGTRYEVVEEASA